MSPIQSELITSSKNPKIQLLRSLLQDRSARAEFGAFITEGIRLGEEVIGSGTIPRAVYFTRDISKRGSEVVEKAALFGTEIFELSREVMDKCSDTDTAQGLLMVVPQAGIPLPNSPNLVLILDQLRDPGNCGTILRTAAAAGVKLVFLTPGSVDPYMPKVVRSAMGAHFRTCIRQTEWSEILQFCRPKVGVSLKIIIAESSGGQSLWKTDFTHPLALVIGGEADGASVEARSATDVIVHIPMPGQFESLNAGVAASILIFEAIRQRTR